MRADETAAPRPVDDAGLAFAARPGFGEEVLFAVGDRTGHVLLNRPRAINSLTHAMVQATAATLQEWLADARIDRLVLRGAGERGLCAGGDIKAARQAVIDGHPEVAARFWADEYALFETIATYPKPVEVVMTGVVMGGGLGLGAHARVRRVLPDARIAMPETGIGFFPDAGSCRLLARAPGELGTYVALTGATLGAADAIALGLGDPPPETGRAAAANGSSALLGERDWIDECFTGDDPAVIAQRLERHTDERARACGDLLRTRSPLSVAIALERVRRAASEADLAHTLAVDARVAAAMMRDSDFVEGVRASVLDKNAARWRHARVEAVPRGVVLSYFS